MGRTHYMSGQDPIGLWAEAATPESATPMQFDAVEVQSGAGITERTR